MKQFVSVLVILIILAAFFFGLIYMISKSMKSDDADNPSETKSHIMQSRTQARELEKQQKRLLEQRRMRMRDLQRR